MAIKKTVVVPPHKSEWMQVMRMGQLTRDATLKTQKELEQDRQMALSVESLRQQQTDRPSI